jgi:uncharacterized protein YceH (UPF0502 family)
VAVEPDGGTGRYRVEGPPPTPPIVATLASWCETKGALIVELRSGGGTLEERYLELIGSAGAEALEDDDSTAVESVRGRAGDPARLRGRGR